MKQAGDMNPLEVAEHKTRRLIEVYRRQAINEMNQLGGVRDVKAIEKIAFDHQAKLQAELARVCVETLGYGFLSIHLSMTAGV